MLRLCFHNQVLVHDGKSAGRGHYWVYVRQPGSEQWWRFNDRVVTAVSEDEVGLSRLSPVCLLFLDLWNWPAKISHKPIFNFLTDV